MKEIKRYTNDEEITDDGWRVQSLENLNGEWVKYTDHKAVVETMQKENKSLISEKDVLQIIKDEKKKEYDAQLEINLTLRKRIEELEEESVKLKELMNGTDNRYYCTEHGYLEGVEVTFEELCEYCKRPVSHGLPKFDN